MLAIAIFVAMLIQPAAAIDVGDVFFVSNGTGNTVINIVNRSAESLDNLAQSFD
jgi:flavoprotein